MEPPAPNNWKTPIIQRLMDSERLPLHFNPRELAECAEPIMKGQADLGFVVWVAPALATVVFNLNKKAHF